MDTGELLLEFHISEPSCKQQQQNCRNISFDFFQWFIMSREIPWRALCPEIVRCRQLQALYGPTMFLVRRPGPLSLVLQGSANSKPIKVRLSGVQHWCSCKTFTFEKELCVHLCWGLLRLFRILPSNPLSFQVYI